MPTAITRQLTKDKNNSSTLTSFSVTMLNSMVRASIHVLFLFSWPLEIAIHFSLSRNVITGHSLVIEKKY